MCVRICAAGRMIVSQMSFHQGSLTKLLDASQFIQTVHSLALAVA